MTQTWIYQFSSSSHNILNFISAEYLLLKMCGLFTTIIICPLFYTWEYKQKGGRKLPNARNYFPAKPWSSSCIVNYFTHQKRSTKRQQDAQQDTISISQHAKSPPTTCPQAEFTYCVVVASLSSAEGKRAIRVVFIFMVGRRHSLCNGREYMHETRATELISLTGTIRDCCFWPAPMFYCASL